MEPYFLLEDIVLFDKVIKAVNYLCTSVKFIYSERATKVCETSTVGLSFVVPVKSTVEIFQNFVALSEYMNFTFTSFLPELSPWQN